MSEIEAKLKELDEQGLKEIDEDGSPSAYTRGKLEGFNLGVEMARKEELEFLTHLFANKECPDGDIMAMGMMISAVSPFAKLINSRIAELKQSLEENKK